MRIRKERAEILKASALHIGEFFISLQSPHVTDSAPSLVSKGERLWLAGLSAVVVFGGVGAAAGLGWALRPMAVGMGALAGFCLVYFATRFSSGGEVAASRVYVFALVMLPVLLVLPLTPLNLSGVWALGWLAALGFVVSAAINAQEARKKRSNGL